MIQPIEPNRKRIAVIGGGVAGLTAAYLLDGHHDVTLLEKNAYLGGHTNTFTVPEGPHAGLPIDTGFIVMNDRNYPLFRRLLDRLEVRVQPSDMSFSYHCLQTGYYYNGRNLNGLLAQRRNLVRPRFLRMISDIFRFYREAGEDLQAPEFDNCTLGEYLTEKHFSSAFVQDHLVPMASAIWSTPPHGIADYPAKALLHFFRNHGLLQLKERPQWNTVRGGSQTYVRRIIDGFRGEIVLRARPAAVHRTPAGPRITFQDGAARTFDAAVIAAHADEALALLADPSPDERRLLGAWRYEPNHTVLHTHPSVLPPRRRAWASWNFLQGRSANQDAPVSVTYYMNLLQNLQADRPYFVSLNQPSIPDEAVLMETTYTHPTYSFASLATQAELPRLNGRNQTWFCGSYFGYGFHEDAVRSGVSVAQDFGIAL